MSTNIIIYVRVSTPQQVLDNQAQLCIDYAREHSYNILFIIEDIGSGYGRHQCKNQKNLMKLLDDIQNGVVTCNKLLVNNYDRLSRNLDFALVTLNILSRHGITVESVIDNIGHPVGSIEYKTQIRHRFVQAEYESDLISLRVRNGIRASILRGTYVNLGSVKYGFTRIRDIDNMPRLIPNDIEQGIIQFIKDLKKEIRGCVILNRLADIKSCLGLDIGFTVPRTDVDMGTNEHVIINDFLNKMSIDDSSCVAPDEAHTEQKNVITINDDDNSDSDSDSDSNNDSEDDSNDDSDDDSDDEMEVEQLADIEIEYDKIYYGISYKEIADFLNKHGIYKRNREWSVGMVSRIAKCPCSFV